jgi:hypothetical protein
MARFSVADNVNSILALASTSSSAISNQLAPWIRILLENLTVKYLVNELHPRFVIAVTRSYPEPDESNSHTHTVFLDLHLDKC